MSKPLCIYHANCADGFAAAWVVRNAFLKDAVEFYPGVYQNDPPDVSDRVVIMVDFSYKRPIIEKMLDDAASVTILDHHKSAIEDLKPLISHPLLITDFDLNRSGAMIAWRWYNGEDPSPPLIHHIEDRDLWRFALPKTREIQAAVFSYPYDFEVWDRLMAMPVGELAVEGVAIERKHHKDIAELVGVCRRTMKIDGIVMPVANLPYTLTSDAGNKMAKEHESKIGCCYWDTPEGRVFSLRSTNDGPDVSAIAVKYGGGGHPHASGFRMPLGWEGDNTPGVLRNPV